MHNAGLLLILSLACLSQATRAANLDEALIGEAVALDDGGTVRLADYIGNRPVYVKFWASWCVPCREQMPHLERTWREHGDEIEIVSVNIWVNETEAAIVATRDEFGLTVPIAIDQRGRLAKAFDFFGTPWHVLIDTDGNIVHTGHEADADVDRKIGLLAARQGGKLPAIELQPKGAPAIDIGDMGSGVTALFFTATWCDWYLEDSRPAMSRACIEAQRTMNRVHELLPDLRLLGVATPLWTTDDELREYVSKFGVAHDFAIDTTNDAFFALNVKDVPTLVVMMDGKEVSRLDRFVSPDQIAREIERASSRP